MRDQSRQPQPESADGAEDEVAPAADETAPSRYYYDDSTGYERYDQNEEEDQD